MYALFLSYNRQDADAVRDVRARLEARGVRTFVDWHDLTPGLPWPDALERALRDSRAVAVFVGRSGFGVWQQREMHYALYLQAQSEVSLPVAPVILRGADPPAGFLILNTWLDLRAGISDEAIEPLIRTLEGVPQPASPAVDICPYRDLRAFREEDSALFFGRDEAVDAIVAQLDRAKFVAVVGPSGSGKSSVVTAGVVPRLRGRRPPQPVWDHIVFTPGDDPWRRFADALLPLLDASLSEVQRLRESRELADELRNGIAPAIERVVQKSGGSDRLLVVVDQFEELLTLTDASVATGFVRALLDASGRAPMTVLITLRSDYYGKAIQLDRDLSNALPGAQVNLGPMRRDELREIVTRPASIAGLQFEPGLVDRILEDVGDEPGNLPLLEYALSELWSLRSERSLTFAAYQEIGGVTGALTKRANAVYAPLSPSEKLAARRLMTRLVRVSAADEEGAHTRRRAYRDEIDDDASKLVDRFVKARLLVAGDDGTVEVAHESLIRKWDRLRQWLDEDRKFLSWRQQLAIYRAAFADTPLQGKALKEAQKWLHAS